MSEGVETARAFVGSKERATAKLFTHGGSQAVRLPKAFRFDGTEVAIRKEGGAVILEPVTPNRSQTPEERAAFWAKLDAIGGEPMDHPPRDDSPMRDVPKW